MLPLRNGALENDVFLRQPFETCVPVDDDVDPLNGHRVRAPIPLSRAPGVVMRA